ncbi:RND family efflux transporter, MFP subunit [Alteromonadaceae bacterium Bs31]|nr:RND family efflux transporter, MFP subunit [Alteromonadaceae bacterium Bs31]
MGTGDDKTELLKQLTIEPQESEPSHWSFWHLLLVSLAAALLGALLTYLLLPQQAEQKLAPQVTKTPTPSKTSSSSKPALSHGQAILNASGYITARRVATVSAEIMGLITEVTVEEGMQVEEGQILARLNDSKAKVNLALAQAQVQSQAQRVQSFVGDLQEAERVLRRLSRLGEDNYSSEAQRTKAQADVAKLHSGLASARADLNVARLNVERSQEDLNDHTIRAPYSGVITVKNAQPGEIVAPAAAGGGFTRTGICTLVDMDSLEIEVDVNEAYIGRVLAGQKVIANLDAYPDRDIPASVIAIIPTADRAKATVRVRIKIHSSDSPLTSANSENAPNRILPNMGVKVAFFNEQFVE